MTHVFVGFAGPDLADARARDPKSPGDLVVTVWTGEDLLDLIVSKSSGELSHCFKIRFKYQIALAIDSS